MTEAEVKKAIKDIPLGSKVQLIKRNGDIVEVRLMSHDITSAEKKSYDGIEVPEMPAALTVRGGTRFGHFRVEIEDIVNIAWVE